MFYKHAEINKCSNAGSVKNYHRALMLREKICDRLLFALEGEETRRGQLDASDRIIGSKALNCNA